MGAFVDIAGQRFDRLTAISRVAAKPKRTHWRCLCDCGSNVTVEADALKSGKTRSCGCLQRDTMTAIRTTHGMSRTQPYIVWAAMMNRCYLKSSAGYAKYGQRGVAVCERWHDFQNFYSDMGERPSPKHSLDRFPDQAGNYEPHNVRWATATEQARNIRSNVVIEVDGIQATLAEHCERLAVSYQLAHGRLRKGWSADRALHEPNHSATTPAAAAA